MTFFRATATIICLAALSACVSTREQIKAGVATFKGQHQNVIFRKLGYPDERKRIAGVRVYSWIDSESGYHDVPDRQTIDGEVDGQKVHLEYEKSKTVHYSYSCTLELSVNSKGIVTDADVYGDDVECDRYAYYAPKEEDDTKKPAKNKKAAGTKN